MNNVYLDFNASTPIAPEVAQAMHPFLSDHYGNPSSVWRPQLDRPVVKGQSSFHRF